MTTAAEWAVMDDGKKAQLRARHKQWRDRHIERVRTQMRLNRKANPDRVLESGRKWRAANKHKVAAKKAIETLVRNRVIKAPNECRICNRSGIIHGHHPDYSRPFFVVWLCQQCHSGAHAYGTMVHHLGIDYSEVNGDYQKKRPHGPRGQEHGSAKFTNEQIVSIRQEYATGTTSYRKLAKKMGCSDDTIWKILTHKTWGHVKLREGK